MFNSSTESDAGVLVVQKLAMKYIIWHLDRLILGVKTCQILVLLLFVDFPVRLPWLSFLTLNILFPLTGSTQTKVTYLPDGAVVVVFPSNLTVAIETGGHPIMENEHRMHYKRKVIVPDYYVHRLEWRFYLRRRQSTRQTRVIEKIGHRMRVGALSRPARMHDRHEEGSKEKALLVCVNQTRCTVQPLLKTDSIETLQIKCFHTHGD